MPSASLWASVPHYVAAAPNPKAALALVRKLEGLVGVSVDAAELEGAAGDYERQVSLAVAERPRRAGVRRAPRAGGREEDRRRPARPPLRRRLAREFQRFLSQRGPEPGGPAGQRLRPGRAPKTPGPARVLVDERRLGVGDGRVGGQVLDDELAQVVRVGGGDPQQVVGLAGHVEDRAARRPACARAR